MTAEKSQTDFERLNAMADKDINLSDLPEVIAMTKTIKRRTITLTDRAPVRIVENEWAVIASAKDYDNEHEFQANRRYNLRVRQHADGRTIVYGTHSTQFQNEQDAAAGELLTPPSDMQVKEEEWCVWDEIPAAIKRVAANCHCDQIADECIADLPAEDLS